MIIAIDGASASGKGTLSAHLQKHFGYGYLDTGAIYRGVGLVLFRQGKEPTDKEAAIQAAQSLKTGDMLVMQDDPELRDQTIASYASQVSAIPEVRTALFDFQRRFALHPVLKDGTPATGAILDGRDIGTVVCPEAQIKVFLTASTEVRAMRRFKELQSKGKSAIYDTILAEVKERDARDAGRSVAPCKPADDALVLDTSDLDIEGVFNRVLDFIKSKGFKV